MQAKYDWWCLSVSSDDRIIEIVLIWFSSCNSYIEFSDAYMRYLVSLRRMNNIDVGGMATQGASNAKFAE